MQIHDIANVIPAMQPDEYHALKIDIAANGQIEPIWTYRGAIIDGRHRWKACEELGIQPKTREWDGAGSLVSFVLGLNLHRRHLTASQRAVVALETLPHLEAEAKERQAAALKQNATVSQKIDTREEPGRAAEQAAKLANTNRQYVSDAKHLQQNAPELIDKVRDGSLTIPDAKKVASLPVEKRQTVLEKVETGEAKNVQDAMTKAHVSYNSGNNEWYTPENVIKIAREFMGDIDLDPASSDIANEVVQATYYFTAEDDGLTKDWAGRVWMNPPYSGDLIGKFCEKLAQEYIDGNVTDAIILVNNATETAWFQDLALTAGAICFPRSRVKFWNPEKETAAPLQGQALLYLGQYPHDFCQAFRQLGVVSLLC